MLRSEQLYYPRNGVPILTWKMIVKTTPAESQSRLKRPAEWKMYIDAETGEIVERQNMLRFVNGKGRVFDPNPVVTLNDTSINDKSSIPDKAYSEVVLSGLKQSGFLEGPFVTTKTTRQRVKSERTSIFDSSAPIVLSRK